MRVRPGTSEDARAVARVHVGTWQAAYRGIVPDAYLDALNVDDRVEAYERFGVFGDEDRPIFVAEEDGGLVGFAMIGPSREEDVVGEVYAIYVEPSRWDTGAGAALMVEAEAWLGSRWNAATLWVLEGNDRARRFYERFGWATDGAVKDDEIGDVVLREVRYRKTFASA